MIRELRWKGEKTVLAMGPRFCLDRVHAANIVILQSLIREVRKKEPNERPFYRLFGESEMREYGAEGQDAMIRIYDTLQLSMYEVADFPFRVDVGPLHIDVCPLGAEALCRKDGRATVLGSPKRPGDTLDVRPTILIFGTHRLSARWASLGELDADERQMVTRVLGKFRTAGILYDRMADSLLVPPVVKVKLPHVRFRDPEKPEDTLRIRCVERE